MSSGSTTVATNRYEDFFPREDLPPAATYDSTPSGTPHVAPCSCSRPTAIKKAQPESLPAGSGPLTAHDDAAHLDSFEFFGGGFGEDLEAYCDEWLAKNLARVVDLYQDEPKQTIPPANKEP
jgi:hypothetical protein